MKGRGTARWRSGWGDRGESERRGKVPGLGPIGWPEVLIALTCGVAVAVVVVLLFAVIRWLLKQ